MRWWEIARAQSGVISTAQLQTGGRGASAVTRMTGTGELTRLCRGIYLAGGAPMTFRARLWAAALATEGIIGFATAGRLWGVLDAEDSDDDVHIIVPHRRRITIPAGVRLHRVSVPVGNCRERAGLMATSRPWTVLDLLAAMPEAQAFRLADRALQRRWITKSDCATRIHAYPHRTGNVQLGKISARLQDGAAAESERRLHALLRRAGVGGWIPNYEVWAEGELVGVVDVAIPKLRIAIEVDGMAYHVDVDRFRRDRARQNALVALGWTVLRFTWADLTERPGYVVATIARLAA